MKQCAHGRSGSNRRNMFDGKRKKEEEKMKWNETNSFQRQRRRTMAGACVQSFFLLLSPSHSHYIYILFFPSVAVGVVVLNLISYIFFLMSFLLSLSFHCGHTLQPYDSAPPHNRHQNQIDSKRARVCVYAVRCRRRRRSFDSVAFNFVL